MIWNIVFLIVGIALVLKGADYFTDGASAVARRWHVSELVIGLTVVALGTSLPELMVSLFSSLRGSSDMSVGNILGSNIFNTLVIVGASALMMDVKVDRLILVRDIPVSFGFALLLYIICIIGNGISRVDGFLLMGNFFLYMYCTFMAERKNRNTEEETSQDQMPIWKILLCLVLGGGCLVGGGQLMVNNGADLARLWGVSEKVIGLTILAAGTSLPELATSMMAARKGSDGLALGNAIGSNVFNVAFVLGLCSSITPMHVQDIALSDWLTFILCNVVLWVVAFTGKRLRKGEGLVLILCYLAYLLFLLLH